MKYDDDPAAFEKTVLDKQAKHHPHTYERVNHAEIGLNPPMAKQQGAHVPTLPEE
ncbi:hypothetical protein [Nocardia farcinica]|uniref:hypothetical protein n=1 Tax=Nocardia farcinica TaxID=37329 RepID=UPI002458E799|nr:hypothetical protein [Nocardia farcinica]